MTDAIIYAWRAEQGDVWTGEWALDRVDQWVPAEANKYILATPEALVASPEVAKLVAEAEARGMERAAVIADRHLSKVEINEPLWHEGQDWAAESIALAIRAEVPK